MIPVVFLAGPTAVGKTEYAIRLARDLDGEIVSADSMQIYRFLDIGSAKPTQAERNAAVHWLVDEIDPREPFSVADYQTRARACVRDIASRGRLPIVSGGTGLYLSSLLYDMDLSAPRSSGEFKSELWERCGRDPQKLHARLAGLDPEAAALIHPNNVKRVLRYVERLESGEGETLARFAEMDRLYPEYDAILTALTRDRSELYDRIERRVDALMTAGLPEEVEHLAAMGLTVDDVSMKGIGYKEILQARAGGRTMAEAAEEIKKNTRHYAKRQLTWLRRYDGLEWFTLSGDAFDEDAYARLKHHIEERLHG